MFFVLLFSLFFLGVGMVQELVCEFILVFVLVELKVVWVDILCKFLVELSNSGSCIVDVFVFDVFVGGVKFDVYDCQFFFDLVGVGEMWQFVFFNFWLSEMGWDFFVEGFLIVEVRLCEVCWVIVEEGEIEQVWIVVGFVEGLLQLVSVIVDVE